MRIGAQTREGVTILEPKGKIVIGDGDVELREAVDAALDAGSRSILVNLKKATRMDSSGLAELIAAFNKVRATGGSLKLVNLPPKIQNVLGITQLISVFDVFDNEVEAIASFN